MSDAVEEAKRLYQDSIDALSDQRRQISEDLRFTDPSSPKQWDQEQERKRKNDPGGARPCMVFDQCGQYIANVAGQCEQRPPSMHAIPAEGGDKKVAEQLDGHFRHIEYASRTTQHYPRVLTSAARVGVGYLVVRPEYVNRALNYQEPRISSEGDPLRVVFDPWSVELDGSDADHGFILSPLSHRQFEAKYGAKTPKVSFTDPEKGETDARESVFVAEGWRAEESEQTMYACQDQNGGEMTLSEDDYQKACEQAGTQLPARKYKDKARVVKWGTFSGERALVEEVTYPASGIGIVPMYGYVSWADGRMKYCGIGRRAMEPQRAYNMHKSEMWAYMAGEMKAPYFVPIEGLVDGGMKDLYDRMSVDQRAYLPYRSRDENGNAIPPPSRAQIGIDLQNHVIGAEQALKDIQASIGMYQANLGAPSNESSGVAIESRKQQGEASTAHFPSHLAATLGQVGKLCMEMLPKLLDTQRQIRILGFDGTPSHVDVNPQQQAPVEHTQTGISINPNIGRYDVRVVVGASFSTQRTQTQQALSEVMSKNPGLTPAIAPLWAQTLDIPNADKLAQVLTVMAPPEVKAILSPDTEKQPNPAELIQKINQLQQGLQEAIQHAHAAQQDADDAHALLDQEKQAGEAREQELQIKAYDAETKRLQVTGANEQQIQAITEQLVTQMLQSQLPQEPEPGPDAWKSQEPAEPEEEPEPQTSPELQALIQGHGQLADAVGQLIKLQSRARHRIPVRDDAGNISHVIEQLAPEEQPEAE